MKRRSFLTLLGLSPVVARAAPPERTASSGTFMWPRGMRVKCFDGYITTSSTHVAYNTAPRTREGVRD